MLIISEISNLLKRCYDIFNDLFIDFPKTDHGLNQQKTATKTNASLSPTSAEQKANYKAYAKKNTATCKKYDVAEKIKNGIMKGYFISNFEYKTNKQNGFFLD